MNYCDGLAAGQPAVVQEWCLDNPITEEVLAAVIASPTEKAPGPNDYIGVFFRSCSQTIQSDMMNAFRQFYNLAGGDIHKLNSALVA